MIIMKYLYSFLFILFAIFLSSHAQELQIVEGIEVYHWTKREKNVVVLFTKENCTESDNLEEEIIGIKSDLEKKLRAIVIKTVNNSLSSQYSANLNVVPILIFFRRSIPLWYNGTMKGKEILHHFMENKESTVTILTDSNFEKVTQARTGSAGDWLVFFYPNDCVISSKSQSLWEAIGAALKNQTNVGSLETINDGFATARSLKVRIDFDIAFFQKGNMYLFRGNVLNIRGVVNFAKIGYKEVSPINVIKMQSLPNDLHRRKVARKEVSYSSKIKKKRYALMGQIFIVAVAVVFIIGYVVHISKKRQLQKQKIMKKL